MRGGGRIAVQEGTPAVTPPANDTAADSISEARPLRLYVHNVHGLAGTHASDKLQASLERHDIVVVTETWVTEPASLPRRADFHRLSCPARPSAGRGRPSGGIAVYWRSQLGLTGEVWQPSGRLDYLWVRLSAPAGLHLYLCAVYIPPESEKYDDISWVDALTADIDHIRREDAAARIVLVGDFNARTGTMHETDDGDAAATAALDPLCDDAPPGLPARRSCDSVINNRGHLLLQLCRDTGLAIVNGRAPGNSGSTPTSLGTREDGRAVVDYVLVPVEQLAHVLNLDVISDGRVASDHNALSAEVKALSSSPPDPLPAASAAVVTERFLFPAPTHDDYDLVKLRLGADLAANLDATASEFWSSLPLPEHVKAIYGTVLSAMERHLRRARPPQPPRGAASRHPWFTPRLLHLHRRTRHRAAALHRAQDTTAPNSPEIRQARARLQSARAEYKAARRAAETAWRSSAARRFQTLHKRDPRGFWRRFGHEERTAPSLPEEAVAEGFRARANPDVQPLDPAPFAALARDPTVPVPACLARLEDPFTDSEMDHALQAMKTGRAADEHGITAEVLRLLKGRAGALTALFNRFLDEGFPGLDTGLDCSRLLPLYKGKGSTADLDNFRGISILPTLSKLYAMLLERRLSRALEAAGLRADSQFGFRRKRGTVEAAFVLSSVWDGRHLSKTQRAARYFLFVDFAKAFDTVQRPVLWQLLRNLRLPETFVGAIESYYASVRFRVELPSGLTRPVPAGLGVKQGCPLSPTLFGVFIEAMLGEFVTATRAHPDAAASVQLGNDTTAGPVDPLLFADDLALLATTFEGLQWQANLLVELAARYGMSINVGKTKAMAVGVQQKDRVELPPLQLLNESVEWVEEFRYLGLVLHATKGFDRAAETLLAAATSRYHMVWRRCRELAIEDAASLCTLFDSLVHTVLGYGVALWGPGVFSSVPLSVDAVSTMSLGVSIERLQRRFQRAVLGVPQLTPTVLVAIETRRPPLRFGFFRSALRLLHSLAANRCCRPRSLLARALDTAVALHRRHLGSWVSRLCDWAKALDVPLDLSSLDPQEEGARRSARQLEAAATTKPCTPTSDPDQGHGYAVRNWVNQIATAYPKVTAGQPRRGLRYSSARHVHAMLQLEHLQPSPAASWWTRRPPASVYDAHPSLAARSLVARTRLGLPVRDIRVYNDGDLVGSFISTAMDGRGLDPDPPAPCANTACRGRSALRTLEHAVLVCRCETVIALRQSLAANLEADATARLRILGHPPAGWPNFVSKLSAHWQQQQLA